MSGQRGRAVGADVCKEFSLRNLVLVCCSGLLALGLSAPAAADCKCSTAKRANGWCADCKVGYFAGEKISAKKLYDALAGEPIAEPDKLRCPGCQAALKHNGKCEHCGVAFAGKQRYKSPVAWYLALGKRVEPTELKCSADRAAARDHGWCGHCKAGQVGKLRYTDKQAYEHAPAARETLRRAVKAAATCEACAVAMVTDGRCARCKVSFKDGKPLAEAQSQDKPSGKP